MSREKQKLLNLIFLFVFLTITLFINFFHTETIITQDNNCPACNFLKSNLTKGYINFFHLSAPVVLEMLKISYSFNYSFIFSIDLASRSPPQI